jgi:adhesin/invasin
MTLAPAIDVPSVSISYVPLSPTQVHVTFSAPTIYADGTSHTTAQVHVFDAADNPVDDATVSLASSDAGETIGPVTSEGNGTFDATITASGTVGAATITAHAVGETADATGTGTLTQKAGPASAVIVALAPSSIVADGTSTTTATVTLSDVKSRRVTGDPVVLTSSDSGQKIGALADNGDGTYTAVITSSKAVGTATITATDGSAFGMTILTQTAPPGGGQGPGTPSGKPKLTLPKSLKRSATALTISVSGLTAGSAVQVKLKLGRAALVASTRTATTSALTLKLRLSKKARTRLRSARHARKLTLSVSVTPPGASSTSLTGSLKLKP